MRPFRWLPLCLTLTWFAVQPMAEAGRVKVPAGVRAPAKSKSAADRRARVKARAPRPAKPGIIATIGPSSAQPNTLRRMVKGGMQVARINLSHNGKRSATQMAQSIRAAARAEGKRVPILFDLPGGKVRLGAMGPRPVNLVPGKRFDLLPAGKTATSSNSASVAYRDMAKHTSVGERVLLDDGRIELEVTRVSPKRIETRVVRGGNLRSRMGVALQSIELPFPAMTAQDRRKLKIAVEAGADWIGVSMVQSPKNLESVRRALDKLGASHVRVVSKIESRQAMKNLDAIIDASDAVMIARGDLATAVGPGKLAQAQARIAERSRARGKPFIVASNLMSGMAGGGKASKANLADVDRAARQGSRWLMLNETALAPQPTAIVETVTRQLQ